jgi:L-lactate dehydrogenase complex protein LldF
VVCPVKIPLPDLLRKLRERQFTRGLRPLSERLALAIWGWIAQHPALYAAATRAAAEFLAWIGGRERMIHRLAFGRGWTDGRDFPAPEGRTFRDLYSERERRAHASAR